ncbi:unnamed protein product [Acanthoscelides obtectus]|uniref:Uncharacterized protein n=1 Tax=Acanthoscelides obtectus TaxID=200917 RepID=A0A9P0NUV4_ACAOB|nr:unnamed protein product [Acanthoscelides obtectus]CAK1657956.1 hypothetical protein AOBTE_LOCUS20618 [Acanthoscelides obtectus]
MIRCKGLLDNDKNCKERQINSTTAKLVKYSIDNETEDMESRCSKQRAANTMRKYIERIIEIPDREDGRSTQQDAEDPIKGALHKNDRR